MKFISLFITYGAIAAIFVRFVHVGNRRKTMSIKEFVEQELIDRAVFYRHEIDEALEQARTEGFRDASDSWKPLLQEQYKRGRDAGVLEMLFGPELTEGEMDTTVNRIADEIQRELLEGL